MPRHTSSITRLALLAATAGFALTARTAVAENQPMGATPPGSNSQLAPKPAPAPAPPIYTPVRWNEDYSYLATQPDADLFDPLKHVPLGADGFYASFGAQARIRYEGWNNELFGSVENDWGYALQRYLAHVDLHLGPNFRVFAQGKSSLVDDGRDLPTPRATDADEIDVQQLFVDAKLPFGDAKDSATLRVGRQDLIYGAQRLISPLDWTNVRRTFEGGKVSVALGTAPGDVSQTIDAFLVRPVIVDKEELNDGNGNVAFAGVYDTIGLPDVLPGGQSKLELYALGLFTSGPTVDSDVYTVGTRFSSQPKPWDLDVELDYQFGKQGDLDICAYSIALEGGYTFVDAQLTPRLYLGFDYASGDGDPTDGDFNTFNQLFPLGHAYFGYIDVVGRQNIIDVHPGVELTLLKDARYAKKVSLRSDYHLFWRADENDGLYSAAGTLVRPAAAGVDARFVGSEIDVLVNWQVDRHLLIYAGYSHFFAGDFIDDSAGADEDIDFVYVAAQYTF